MRGAAAAGDAAAGGAAAEALAALDAAYELRMLRDLQAFRTRHAAALAVPASAKLFDYSQLASAAPPAPPPRESPPRLFALDERLSVFEYGVPHGYADAYDNAYARLPDATWRDAFVRVSIPVASTLLPPAMRPPPQPPGASSYAAGARSMFVNDAVAADGGAHYRGGALASHAATELNVGEEARLRERAERTATSQSRTTAEALERGVRMRFQLQSLHQQKAPKVRGLAPRASPYPNL